MGRIVEEVRGEILERFREKDLPYEKKHLTGRNKEEVCGSQRRFALHFNFNAFTKREK
jgi:hypothetical protein